LFEKLLVRIFTVVLKFARVVICNKKKKSHEGADDTGHMTK